MNEQTNLEEEQSQNHQNDQNLQQVPSLRNKNIIFIVITIGVILLGFFLYGLYSSSNKQIKELSEPKMYLT